MSREFIISDTHFGHKNIIIFEKEHRPFDTIEQHDEELVYRWNHEVKPGDVVWHGGDVLFGKRSFDYLARLNGTKYLVLGNHDTYPLERYLRHFKRVFGCVSIHKHVLTHMPVHESQFGRFVANLHGHLHSKTIDDNRYINVSAEVVDLRPVPLDSVLKKG